MHQTEQEAPPKRRVRHIMDLKRPRLLVLVIGAVVCAGVGALLLANPGQRADQIDGVQMTTVRVLDRGVPVDLPEHLSHEIVPLIREYDNEDFNDLASYLAAPGDVVLSDRRGGTVYYLTSSLDRELVLVRTNHDRDGWTSARKGVTLTGLKDDPAYRKWREQTEQYLEKGRADDLYLLKTAYIGNHVADEEILEELNVGSVAGPYTIELRTEKEPYGLTLHLETYPAPETEQVRLAGYLREVGTLFTALADNAAFFNWDCLEQNDDGSVEVVASGGVQPGLQKPVDRDAFQTLYENYREALSGLADPAVAETGLYALGEALYLSPEMPWRDMPFYTGSVTVSPDLFAVQLTHVLSSAMPQISDICANPLYSHGNVPEELPLQDDAWPSQQYLELTQAQEPSPAQNGVLPLGDFTERSCLVVCDGKGVPTPYRLYRLDGETWLSHETAGVTDWVFRLTDQPGTPLPTDEAE